MNASPVPTPDRAAGTAAWAVALAALIAFMGIGVVDPILPEIGRQLGASSTQVELLFTTYLGVMAVMTLFAGRLGARFGRRRVALTGLGLISLFALLCGLSSSIPALAVFRAGWGFGSALFTPTALVLLLALIPRPEAAVMRYEAAIGLGMSMGPLLGGVLGGHSWRYPFFGAALLMLLAFVSVLTLVRVPDRREQVGPLSDVFRAYRHPAFLNVAVTGGLYYFCFFVLLGFTPLFLKLSVLGLGLMFFGWGVLLGVGSTVVVERLLHRTTPSRILRGTFTGLLVLFLLLGLLPGLVPLKVALVILSGLLFGINNSLLTTLSVEVSSAPRATATSAYNFLRWAGAAFAPLASGLLAEHVTPDAPYLVGAALLLVCAATMVLRGRHIDQARRGEEAPITEPAGTPSLAHD
ncbi:MFS transporter [Deinococcus aquiradiocola]|uniref:MFS transporter n=1 Tax=Deinococcus aquiradiocola TaxID=393059 RepID=A0A917PG86_9DEIO|nr:MFS transporter [Deinococcus aquiradiocola]GGJ75872.1 MFS transporter [Deinococcus aquiradiocola]